MSDAAGVAGRHGGCLDRAYLASWAVEMNTADLLDRALREAGASGQVQGGE